MKNIKLGLVIGSLAVLLVISAIAYLAGAASASDGRPELTRGWVPQLSFASNQNLVTKSINFLREMYYKELTEEDEQRLIYGALKGMFMVLHDEPFEDRFSNFYGPEMYEELEAQTTGEYAGIGILMGLTDDGMYAIVNRVFLGTPAEEAGVQDQDIITEINGDDSYGMPLVQVATRIKGEPGTTVEVKFYRPSIDDYVDLTIERRFVQVSSVPKEETKLMEGNIGIVQITNFAEDTGTDFRAAVESLLEQGMEALVIDLRGNSGGLVDSAVHVAECFIQDGLVVKVISRDQEVQRINANPNVKKYDIPVVILQNKASASASEILAGALQDYGVAKIVGTDSFGKGVVQAIQPLEYKRGLTRDGASRKVTKSALAITIGQYFTLSEREIHGNGLEPNIWYNIENRKADDPVLGELQREIEAKNEEIRALWTEMNQHIRLSDTEIERAVEVARMMADGQEIADVPKLEPKESEHSPLASSGRGKPQPQNKDSVGGEE